MSLLNDEVLSDSVPAPVANEGANHVLTPTKRATPATPPAQPSTIEPRTTFESLKLVDSIRESVVRDIVDKDSAHLTDALAQRLAPQLRDQIKTGVSAEFSDRVRMAIVVVAAATSLMGFLGYTSLAQMVQNATENASKRQVAAQFSQYEASISQMSSRAEAAVSKSVQDAQARASDLRTEMNERATRKLFEFKEEIERRSKSLLDDAKEEAKKEAAAAVASVKEQHVRLASDIGRLRDRVVGDVSSAAANPVGSQLPTREEREVESDPETAARDRAVLELDTNRAFDLASIERVAALFDASNAPEPRRSVFDPVYNWPAAFSAEDRLRAAALLLDERVHESVRRSTAIELMITAVRVDDRQLFKRAEDEYDRNLYTRAQNPDRFVELIKLAMQAPGSAEARTAFAAVDRSKLTHRGRLNLILLGKIVGESEALSQLLRGAIDELFVDLGDVAYLDRYTDYSSAAHVLDVLLREPIVEKERVTEAVRRIKGLIFKSDSDPDPFALRQRIDEFLGG